MPLSTYAELQTSIGSWLNREDLSSQIPDFIRLAEAQMAEDLEDHWRLEERAEVTSNGRYIERPDNWRKTIRLTADGDYKPMKLLNAAEMGDLRYGQDNATGQPRFYRHVENLFELFPTPGDDLTLRLDYLKQLEPLSDSNTSNWVLDEAPDAYLYGSLMHAHVFLIDDQRVQQFAAVYSAVIARLMRSSNRAKGSGSGTSLRVRGLGGGGHRHVT